MDEHGDDIAAHLQMRRQVVFVVPLIERIAAHRSAPDLLTIDVENVAAIRRDFYARRVRLCLEFDLAPQHEPAILRVLPRRCLVRVAVNSDFLARRPDEGHEGVHGLAYTIPAGATLATLRVCALRARHPEAR